MASSKLFSAASLRLAGTPEGGFLHTVAVGADGYARVPLALMDLISGQSVEPTSGVLAFGSKVDYDPAGVQVLRVGYGQEFEELDPPSTIIDNATGTAQIFGFAPVAGANPPLAQGFVYPRLVGPAAQPYTFEWDSAAQPPIPYVYRWTAVGAEVENTEQITFRRGDLDASGSIDALDATIMKKAIVGTRLPCDDPWICKCFRYTVRISSCSATSMTAGLARIWMRLTG